MIRAMVKCVRLW